MFRRFTLTAILCCFAVATLAAQDNQQRQRRSPFDRFFTVPGVEFSAEQLVKVAEIRKEFEPKIEVTQTRWDAVITDEQVQARREAFQQAREAGKEGDELRSAVEAAVLLSEAQRAERAKLQDERNELLAEIRMQLIALLTDEQRPRRRQERQPRQQTPAPTHANVKYGPHERNVLDVWLAKSDKPTPVLVSIHGGGFRAGNKSVDPGVLNQCLASGISVAAITYRFSQHAIAPASFHDSARAVQTLRYKAKDWKLDTEHFAGTGGSAGAGISLWLGFHDDLADPDNADPVLRESSRLQCMMVSNGQTSYDPRVIRKLFPDSNTYQHSALAALYDADLRRLDDLPEEKYRLFEECSAITHLTKDDAPAMLSYGGGFDQKVTNENIGIHHARFGTMLKEKMDELGIRCVVNAGGETLGSDRRLTQVEFMQQTFGMAEQ